MRILICALLFGFTSCVAECHTRLDTTWQGEAHPGVMSTLAFDLKGHARWTFDLPSGAETYDLKYELTQDRTRPQIGIAQTPDNLDFTGFTKGPYAGKTLYGIAVWDSETLRLDAQPGDPKQGGDSVRPKEFTDHALTFKRVRQMTPVNKN